MKSTVLRMMTVMLAILLAGVITQPATAQVEIPAGATIDSATFTIYVRLASNQTVNLHRVTADWDEHTVTWNNFGDSFDASLVDSFVTDSLGIHSANLTSLVQDWVDGVYPNFGIFLEQGRTEHTSYSSSEDVNVSLRPSLEICYTDDMVSDCVTIQRPGAEQDGVTDAYIWEMYPDSNMGSSSNLYTGIRDDCDKQSLIKFDFTMPEPFCGDGYLDSGEECDDGNNIDGDGCDANCMFEEEGGEGCTPGYWKQDHHFDSWVRYQPNDYFEEIFDVSISIRGKRKGHRGRPRTIQQPKLRQALHAKGGGINALARHSVAALLNASSPDVDYAYSIDEVIMMVQDAIDSGQYRTTKNMLKDENGNLTPCPLN